MKRIFLFLALAVSAATFQSCEGDQGPAGPAGPDSIVYEITTNFAPVGGGEYSIYRTFGSTLGFDLFDSESVLIYRLSGTIDASTPIWKLIPRTLYLPEGELDYDYDFSLEDFTIYAGGTFDPGQLTPEYLNNQTFRLVIIPGTFANKTANPVNTEDYNAVIKAYNIDDSHVKTIK